MASLAIHIIKRWFIIVVVNVDLLGVSFFIVFTWDHALDFHVYLYLRLAFGLAQVWSLCLVLLKIIPIVATSANRVGSRPVEVRVALQTINCQEFRIEVLLGLQEDIFIFIQHLVHQLWVLLWVLTELAKDVISVEWDVSAYVVALASLYVVGLVHLQIAIDLLLQILILLCISGLHEVLNLLHLVGLYAHVDTDDLRQAIFIVAALLTIPVYGTMDWLALKRVWAALIELEVRLVAVHIPIFIQLVIIRSIMYACPLISDGVQVRMHKFICWLDLVQLQLGSWLLTHWLVQVVKLLFKGEVVLVSHLLQRGISYLGQVLGLLIFLVGTVGTERIQLWI